MGSRNFASLRRSSRSLMRAGPLHSRARLVVKDTADTEESEESEEAEEPGRLGAMGAQWERPGGTPADPQISDDKPPTFRFEA